MRVYRLRHKETGIYFRGYNGRTIYFKRPGFHKSSVAGLEPGAWEVVTFDLVEVKE